MHINRMEDPAFGQSLCQSAVPGIKTDKIVSGEKSSQCTANHYCSSRE